jgi:peptidase C39-like protein
MLSEPIQQRLRRTASGLLFTAQYHSRMLYLNQRHKMRVTSPLVNDTQSQHDGCTSSMTALPSDAPLSASFQTAKEKFECASSTSHSTLRKNQLEHVAPPAVFPLAEDTWKYTSLSAPSPKGEYKPVRAFSALPTAKQRTEDHHTFMGNVPTLPINFTTNTKAAQHSFTKKVLARCTLAKQQNALYAFTKLKSSRYPKTSLFGAGLVALVLIALVAQSSLAHQAFNTSKTTHVSSIPSSGVNTTKQQVPTRLASTQQPTHAQQPTPVQQQTPVQQPTPISQPTSVPQIPAQQQAPSINASKTLVRLSQLDPDEYASRSEFNTWANSACSTASLTEVFNAYGNHYRITDVLRVESKIGVITPDAGLLESDGIARTAAKFGFSTKSSDSWTLDQLLHYANQGSPVIVDWPPNRYTDGHIVVVIGGDPRYVYLADSSSWNRHKISRAQFTQWWGGFAAIVTPE